MGLSAAHILDEAALAALAAEAERDLGLLRLGAVDLEHPGFAPARAALERYLERGFEGEMGFMRRTAAVRKDPAQMLPGARSALVAVVPYAGEAGPIARYAQSADYHTELHRRLEALAARLATRLPGVSSLICVDTKPLLERSAAVLAGLGFLGKNGCLIVPGLGSYVLIGALLTTAIWAGPDLADSHATHGQPWSACGSCRLCLDACPTQAFDAPGDLDPRRCVAYLTIEHRGTIPEALAAAMGERVAGCDLCQEVCPYNRSETRPARVPANAWLPPPPGRPRTPELPRLAVIGNNQHRQFVKQTALNRIPRRALRRNALLAMGNGRGPLSAEASAALERAVEDPDPELAALARRARARRK
ncbi:tRNA epoxyqueuosine(34) reductase QueG [Pseudenhygromyxa sp. WMMC2535]|uniref:tRNA epoxyqueuosine(34) reductase QueG n=1 Tax=Pseudenhygromyxa sp. WMMC2535 TaxID=2712867 RepID=UPI001554D654|nr:tRNA epoxyqueuosine(34) reductase QueG [Pseudenhygromyxa sp. WMMC2535]NVB37360.1 tRNA epoxyqueuosine(34) reductase QueG [Pseudenhygromyxa sp. WMMC2535]